MLNPPQGINDLWSRKRINEAWVSVKDYGAVGDGVVDDTTAVQAAMVYLLALTPAYIYGEMNRITGEIYFPPGTYLVTNRVFDNLNWTNSAISARKSLCGFKFSGAHNESSKLKLKTSGQESWFYDNGSDNHCFQRMYFQDLKFTSDSYLYGNGFKIWSEGGEKQFEFLRCYFEDINNLFWTTGNGNADLSRFDNCKGQIYGDILTLNNTQSVDHEFRGCSIGTYGNFIHVMTNGGGHVLVDGGAIDFLYHETYSPVAGNYLVNLDSDANISAYQTYTFRNCRIEIEAYMDTTGNPLFGLVKTYLNTSLSRIIFDGVSFIDGVTFPITSGTSEFRKITAIDLYSRKYVHFKDCILLKNFYYNITGSYSTDESPSSGGIIKMENCYDGVTTQLPSGESDNSNIHRRVTFSGNIGRFITLGMHHHTTGSPFTRVILDYEQGRDAATGNEEASVKKILWFKNKATGFPIPSTNANEITISIPPNFFALRIYIKKHASGSSTETYQLHIGSDDKATIIASSTSSTVAAEHIIDIENVDLSSYATLRFWATGNSAAYQSNGITYIEYV